MYSVSVEADEDSFGRMFHGQIIRRLEDGHELSGRQRKNLEDYIVVALAGLHAERLHTARRNLVGASQDHTNAVHLSGHLGLGSVEQEEAYLKYLDVRAADLVTRLHRRSRLSRRSYSAAVACPAKTFGTFYAVELSTDLR